MATSNRRKLSRKGKAKYACPFQARRLYILTHKLENFCLDLTPKQVEAIDRYLPIWAAGFTNKHGT